jgi:hypothetical protein
MSSPSSDALLATPYDFGIIGMKANEFLEIVGPRRRGATPTSDELMDFFYHTQHDKYHVKLKFRRTAALEGYNYMGTMLEGVEALFVTVDMHDARTAHHAHSIAYSLVNSYPSIHLSFRVLVLFDSLVKIAADDDHTRCTPADIKRVADVLNVEKQFTVYTDTDAYECMYYAIERVSAKRGTSIPLVILHEVVDSPPAVPPLNMQRMVRRSPPATPLAHCLSPNPQPAHSSAPTTTRTADVPLSPPHPDTTSARRRSRFLTLLSRNSSPALMRSPQPSVAAVSSSSSSSAAASPKDCASITQTPTSSPKAYPYESESCSAQ